MKRALQLILTVAVTWLILRQVGITTEDALSPDLVLPDAAWAWLAASAVFLLSGFAVSARLWGMMVGELDGVDPGTGTSLRIVFISNLGRYIPGKVWQVAGLLALSKRGGVPATVGAVAGVLTQVFSLLAAALIATPLLSTGLRSTPETFLIPVLLLAGLLVAVAAPRILHALLSLTFRVARIPGTHLPAIDRWFGARWLGLHTLAWTVYSIAFFLFVRGLGFDGGVIEFVPPFVAAYLLGYLAIFAPAGIGVREGFLIAFLQPVAGTGAVAIALFARLWMTVVELLPAGALALWEIYRRPDPGLSRPEGPTGTDGGASGSGRTDPRGVQGDTQH